MALIVFNRSYCYLQVAQVQFDPQLQSIQVQLGLSHFPFSDSGAFWLNDIDNFIIIFFSYLIIQS